jgi:hypothetical protein
VERPVDIIQRITDSGWEDGGLYADELNHYFDQWDDENLSSQEVADQQAAHIVELEKERDDYGRKYDDLRTKYDKLLDKNYALIMGGGTASGSDDELEGKDPGDDVGGADEPDQDTRSIDDLDMSRKRDE